MCTAIKLKGRRWPGLRGAGGGFHLTALTLTIRTHLIRDRPKPEMAPYRPAADDVRQNDKKKPIQLKRNATDGREKGEIKTALQFTSKSFQNKSTEKYL